MYSVKGLVSLNYSTATPFPIFGRRWWSMDAMGVVGYVADCLPYTCSGRCDSDAVGHWLYRVAGDDDVELADWNSTCRR